MWFMRPLEVEQCRAADRACPKRLRVLWTDRRAVASLEYAIIASLIALAVVPGVSLASATLQSAFTTVAQTLKSVSEQAPKRQWTCSSVSREATGDRVGDIAETCKHARNG